jgi:hypothetical protein
LGWTELISSASRESSGKNVGRRNASEFPDLSGGSEYPAVVGNWVFGTRNLDKSLPGGRVQNTFVW